MSHYKLFAPSNPFFFSNSSKYVKVLEMGALGNRPLTFIKKLKAHHLVVVYLDCLNKLCTLFWRRGLELRRSS